MIFGYGSAIITGVAMPSFVFIMGSIVNSFADEGSNAINTQCLIMTVIGAMVWITSYFYYASLVIMAERISRKTKIAYLKAIL